MECAALCYAAAQIMRLDSSYAKELCKLCAKACRACVEECGKHKDQHCEECAEACKRCAKLCQSMSA